jgi:hypothetical protein
MEEAKPGFLAIRVIKPVDTGIIRVQMSSLRKRRVKITMHRPGQKVIFLSIGDIVSRWLSSMGHGTIWKLTPLTVASFSGLNFQQKTTLEKSARHR